MQFRSLHFVAAVAPLRLLRGPNACPAQMSGKGYVDGKVAVEGDFTFALAKAGKTLA